MANFNTHLTVSAAVSGFLASGLLVVELATLKAAVLFWLLGTTAGFLPDVDSHNSKATRWIFSLLGISIASLSAFSQNYFVTFPALVLFWLGIFITVRYGVFYIFHALTVHRGNFHSVIAALCFGLITTAICHQFFDIRPFVAWGSGFFVTMGYLTHLLLDEIYSVNLVNRRLKKSFGSALKIISLRYKVSTALFLLIMISTFYFTPPFKSVTEILSHQHTYQIIKMKFGLR